MRVDSIPTWCAERRVGFGHVVECNVVVGPWDAAAFAYDCAT